MLRLGTMADNMRLRELFFEMHAASKYALTVQIDGPALQKMLVGFQQRNGMTNDGGTLVVVYEVDGVVEGFMFGLIDRVYHVGDKFVANDAYLYASSRCPARAALDMIDAYILWAESNPRVVETKLSWTNTIDGAEKIEKLYERKGFERSGGIFTRVRK